MFFVKTQVLVLWSSSSGSFRCVTHAPLFLHPLWLPDYQCNKEKLCASIILLLSLCISVFLSYSMFKEQKTISAYCLVPLCMWLLFAYILNTYEVFQKKDKLQKQDDKK